MKKLFLSLVAAMTAAISFAQSTLVATLSHGDEITMYYGAYALKNAHEAASPGDYINLSGGTFENVDITKAVTIRGTGIDNENPTCLRYLTIKNPHHDTYRFSVEGVKITTGASIQGTFNNAYFQKCQFYSFNINADAVVKNMIFADCKITNGCSITGTSSVQFINSYVAGFSNNSETTANASFVNCIIYPYYYGLRTYPDKIASSLLVNCIICGNQTQINGGLPQTTSAINCVSIGFSNRLFQSVASSSGCYYAGFEMFKDYTGTYTDEQTFELTDDAKAQFIGNDDTEVGMHGGPLPYTSVPSYPQITRMNVANKTTADGKLSVEIEVSAAE